MTEQETYSKERIAGRLSWYKDHIEKFLNSKYRRDQEYGNYLKNYFEEQERNPNNGYKEPIPYNLYFT